MTKGNYHGAEVKIETFILCGNGWFKEIDSVDGEQVTRALSVLVEKPYMKVVIPPKLSLASSGELAPSNIDVVIGEIDSIDIKIVYKE